MARVRRDSDPEASETPETIESHDADAPIVREDQPTTAVPRKSAVVWLDLKSGGPFVGTRTTKSPQAGADGKHQLTTRKVVLVPGVNRITADEWSAINPPERAAFLASSPGATLTGLEQRLEDGRLRVLEPWDKIPKPEAAAIALRSSRADLLKELLETERRDAVRQAITKQLALIGERWDPVDPGAARRAHEPS